MSHGAPVPALIRAELPDSLTTVLGLSALGVPEMATGLLVGHREGIEVLCRREERGRSAGARTSGLVLTTGRLPA